MCGIAGLVDFKGFLEPKTVVPRMLRWLDHRGPDEQGTWSDERAGIGTARLAIIDLVSGGQPIANEDETIWACSNGEIYNFRDLRSELERKGHRFRMRQTRK